MKHASFSFRRLRALTLKEFFQVVRDPSSMLLAVVLPLVMIFLYGYALNLDTSVSRVGVLVEDNGVQGERLFSYLDGSPHFEAKRVFGRRELSGGLESGELKAGLVISSDFSSRVSTGRPYSLQLLTDGTEPNTAAFLTSYVQGACLLWSRSLSLPDTGTGGIELIPAYWFNPNYQSRNYLVPGSISVIMSMIGAILTSLVIAREWERGTMEALLASPVTKGEFLISKIVPYFLLGMISMVICSTVAVCVMGIPLRGSLVVLGIVSALFLGSALGMGLFLSTTLRNQFNAAQAALLSALLPNLLLSGFIFELKSMPMAAQVVSWFLPARYFVDVLQTLFQAGGIEGIILMNTGFLFLAALFWLGLTVLKTGRRLDD